MMRFWQRLLFGKKKEAYSEGGNIEGGNLGNSSKQKNRKAYFKRIPRSSFELEELEKVLLYFKQGDESYLDYLYILYKEKDLIAAYILWEVEQLALLAFPQKEVKKDDPMYLPKLLYQQDYLDCSQIDLLRYPKALDWLNFRMLVFKNTSFDLLEKQLKESSSFSSFEEYYINQLDEVHYTKQDYQFLSEIKGVEAFDLLHISGQKLYDLAYYLQSLHKERDIGETSQSILALADYFISEALMEDPSLWQTNERSYFIYSTYSTSFFELMQCLDLRSLSIWNYKKKTDLAQLYSLLTLHPNLETLELKGGESKTTLPPEVKNLKALKELNISDFEQLDKQHFFEEIAELTKLEELMITRSGFNVLSKQIIQLKNIRTLKLNDHEQFDLEGSMHALSEMSNLQNLSLYRLNLVQLPASFGLLSTVMDLELCFNQSLDFVQASSILAQMPKLNSLDLHACDIQLELPINCRFKRLKSLCLDQNENLDLALFFSERSDYTALEELSLDECELEYLPDFNLPNLRYLSVDENPDLDLGQFLKSIASFPKLETLYMKALKLEKLPENISPLASLKALHLCDNPNLDVESVFKFMNGLQIKHLYMENCNLKSLPETLSFQNQLISLGLMSNPDLDTAALFSILQKMESGYLSLEIDLPLETKKTWRKACPFLSLD